MELHLVLKAAIAISKKDGQGTAAHVRGHEIGDAILIDIKRGDGRGVLPDFVAGKVVEQIRRHVGILLGT
jgi:hypothetical protein